MKVISLLVIFFVALIGISITALPIAASDTDPCEQAVLEERKKYDPDGDGKIGLEVAIHALQVVAGIRSSNNDTQVLGECTDCDAYAVMAFSGTNDEERELYLETLGELNPEWFTVGTITEGEKPISEEQARAIGTSLFQENIYFDGYHLQQINKIADLYFLYTTPSDLGAAAFLDSRNGQILFAGKIIWLGQGNLIFPEENIRKPSDKLNIQNPVTSDPAELVFLESEFSRNWSGKNGEGNRVWQLAKCTNLLKSFSKCGDYKVVVWLYTPDVGCVNVKAARAIVLVTGKTTDMFVTK